MTLAAPTVAGYVARAEELAPVIAAGIEETQRLRHLAPRTVAAFHEADLFRLLVPASLGGGGLTVFEAAHVYHAVARIDGSAAWTLALVGSTTMFAAMLEPGPAGEILAAPTSICCGSFQPLGIRFQPAPGGYTVSGTGRFVFGCQHAQWIAAGGFVYQDDRPLRRPSGTPLMLVAFVPMAACRILDTWNSAGLRGTGSHDVAIDPVFVPAERTFDVDDVAPRPWDPLAGLPLVSKLGPGVGSVALGCAHGAVDALVELASAKVPFGTLKPLRERPALQLDVARASALVEAGVASQQYAGIELQRRAAGGNTFSTAELARLRAAYVQAAERALEAVALVHASAGSSTLSSTDRIDRAFRDVHAATQHLAISRSHYERIGRILLGFDETTM